MILKLIKLIKEISINNKKENKTCIALVSKYIVDLEEKQLINFV